MTAQYQMEDFRTEAFRIADDIIDRAIVEGEKCYWKTLQLDSRTMKYSWAETEGLYSGVGGIILFLTDIYLFSGDKRYGDYAVKGLNWLVDFCKNNPTNNYAFLSGRLGSSYVMLQYALKTGDSKYKKLALELSKNCEDFLNVPGTQVDFINGASGSLVALLHLHAATNNERILRSIKTYVEYIIKKSHFANGGIYWDKQNQNIRGLCGFSHGASGVGYAFLELGNYFNNADFYWVAESAFKYENRLFDLKANNWPDFRGGFFNEEEYTKNKKLYKTGNWTSFNNPTDKARWCHGAPGIGIARLRAKELLGKDLYQRDFDRAVQKTRQATWDDLKFGSHTVCHGTAGNAMLFVAAYQSSLNEKYLEYATSLGTSILKSHEQIGFYPPGLRFREEEPSLFMGTAGIGHFFLELCDPLKAKPLINFSLSSEAPPKSKFIMTRKDIIKQLTQAWFPKTSTEIQLPDFREPQISLNYIERLLKKKVLASQNMLAKPYFDFEKKKINFEKRQSNYFFSELKRRIIYDELKDVDNDTIIDSKVKLSGEIFFFTSNLNCIDINDLDVRRRYYVFIPMGTQVTTCELSWFSYTVFKAFKEEIEPASVRRNMQSQFDVLSSVDKSAFEMAFNNQVVTGVKMRILELVTVVKTQSAYTELEYERSPGY